jgi:hypothetical protein
MDVGRLLSFEDINFGDPKITLVVFKSMPPSGRELKPAL